VSAWLPFVVLTVLAIALEVGITRAAGNQRMQRARPGVRLAGVLLLVVAIVQMSR
jgi:uncharacterized membrane protein